MPRGRFIALVITLVVLVALVVLAGWRNLAVAVRPAPRFFLRAASAGQVPSAATLAATARLLAARANDGLAFVGVSGATARVYGPASIEVDAPGLGLDTLDEATRVLTARMGAAFAVLGNGSTELPIGSASTGHPLLATGRDLDPASISAQIDNLGNPVVAFDLQSAAADRVARYTASHVSSGATRYYIAVAVDGHVVSDPYIAGAVLGGSLQIQASSRAETDRLVFDLRAGAAAVPGTLPMALRVSRVDTSATVFRPVVVGLVRLSALLALALLCTVFLVRGLSARGFSRRVPRPPEGMPVWPAVRPGPPRRALGKGPGGWTVRQDVRSPRGRHGAGGA